MAPAFLASLAFNSITCHPISAATALAIVVLPTPGGPINSRPGFFGRPSFHWSNQARIFLRCASFPSNWRSLFGRWRSVQSLATMIH